MERIKKIKDSLCSGCGTCLNVCPVNAIKMSVNEKGFLSPQIDENLCIHCRKCDQVCPIVNKESIRVQNCYAAWASDEIREKSSSGGAFSVFAEYFLENGGIVFGAAWTEDLYVEHTYITSKDELEVLRRSKYVQSNLKDSFKKVKVFLREGKEIMFVGTPCQIAGLRKYLENEDTSKLLLVDFICYYNPPISFLHKFLNENYGLENIKEFYFRDKVVGWQSHPIKVVMKDDSIIYDTKITSYFKGYFCGLYASEACNACSFSGGTHYSDLILGDFWKIEQYNPTWNDRKGTSMILVNSEKGKNILAKTKNQFQRIERVPKEWIRQGQNNCRFVHPRKEYFQELLTYKSFNDAVNYAVDGLYDIGMVCVQSYQNFGSAWTNFALYHLLKDYKRSVLIITQPQTSEIKSIASNNFMKNPFATYENAKIYNSQKEMEELNKMCKAFVVGSDQLFNYEIYKKIDGFIKLNWVADDKRKYSYSTSFGTDKLLGPLNERNIFGEALKKFDAISVREKSGVDLLSKEFGIVSQETLDPVFLCDKRHYMEQCKEISVTSGKVFAYILDPDYEKELAVRSIAKQLRKDVVAMVDRWMSEEYVNGLWDIPVLLKSQNEVWMKYIMESDYVITDSFHGMCFSIIFNKPFVVIKNKKRGSTRFDALLEKLHLEEYIFDSADMLRMKFTELSVIDYKEVNDILDLEIRRSMGWLEENIINKI